MKRFSETLSTKGFTRENTRKARGFLGIKLCDNNSDLFAGDCNDQ
jgi:hypothetical protein